MMKTIRDVWLVLTARVLVIPFRNVVSVQVVQSNNECRSHIEVVGPVGYTWFS